ncbi:PREDICTED: sodium/potassium-transporting ATPase subunit alpha-like [Nicrophorus vespilloides]|uniref:Sodium/potassium-transporting ATPase subunit alpha n=1 Tax=Nicrophorus vespilloides TaxID=110193 RepID=A0ABM1MB83_NICVS|nr:PREDICTED: sodium/potassium-transporting ATPase subunit alpha-like [Nicrophorus vespilloides]
MKMHAYNWLFGRYETNFELGLTTEQADELRNKHGPNALCPPKTRSRWLIFAEYMFGGFSILLWLGAILSTAGWTISRLQDPEVSYDQLYLAIVLVVIIISTGIFGFYQESANTKIMESFKKMIPKSAKVLRGGEKLEIPTEDVTVGDVVLVEIGSCVPADIRIVESFSLKVDNSSITGESEPQLRAPDFSDPNPLETQNLAFYGTNVVEGYGKGVVIAIGDNTLMGHIAGLTSGLQPDETPMKQELRKFVTIITAIAVTMGIIFFIMAMFLGYGFFDAFIYFIAIVVACVPEGLLVTLTASLTLTARRMAKKNCLVKNLDAIETLGSTSVICSDKTGTLTQNRMTVSHIYYDEDIVDVLVETGFEKPISEAFNRLCRVAMLCSRAEFKSGEEHLNIKDRSITGDASEKAVLKFMEEHIGGTIEFRRQYEKIYEVPFNSTNKYQISIHRMPEKDQILLVMKGAPERIIEKCSEVYEKGETIMMDEVTSKKLKKALLELGYLGERVLAFADLNLPSTYTADYPYDNEHSNFPTENLRFLGFISMIDPPRPGVPAAVEKCKSAGIRVIMVTGDHPVTAMSIARKVGIISKENETYLDIAKKRNISMNKVTSEERKDCRATVITGGDLREMDGYELDNVIKNYEEIVFARTSPQQKLQIVEAFQRAQNIVAVTGDGVNDSPALKKADIGIAMGIAGTDVSKEAADIILLDDNFASIVVGIEEGRLIFDNLKKSIAYMLTSNVPEVIPFMMYVIINIPQALSIMSILVIDVGTDLMPGISLAYERPEADIMHRKPRNLKTDKLVNCKLICFCNLNIGLVQTFAGFSCYFAIYSDFGFTPSRLIGIREEWEGPSNDLLDSFGNEWTLYERQTLERKGVTAFFLAIVFTQVADCIICKTRRLSVFQQGN